MNDMGEQPVRTSLGRWGAPNRPVWLKYGRSWRVLVPEDMSAVGKTVMVFQRDKDSVPVVLGVVVGKYSSKSKWYNVHEFTRVKDDRA